MTSLTKNQIDDLSLSISQYDFPQIYWDFSKDKEINAKNLHYLEQIIKDQLTSENSNEVIHGLANVIYWGNANSGYRIHRMKMFITGVAEDQISKFKLLTSKADDGTLLKEIQKLKMPQFSGISFISKITTFLNPENNGILDLVISKLGESQGNKALNRITKTTTIPTTKNNCAAYYDWCNECRNINKKYYGNKNYRAVDIERGFFNLIKKDKRSETKYTDYAKEIYKYA